MKSYKTIIPFLKKNWHHYLIGILMLIIVDAATLIVPQIFRAFTDAMVDGTLNREFIVKLIIYAALIGLVIEVGRYLWVVQIIGTARKLEYWLRDKLFIKYLHFDDEYFHHNRTGDLMARATNDMIAVRGSMAGGIIMITDSIFMTVFTVIMMVYTVGLKTAAISLVSLPFLALAISKIAPPIQRRSRKVQDSFSDVTTEVQENFSGIRVIKAFATEDNRENSFENYNEIYRKKNMDLMRVDALFDPLINFISGISFVVLIYYGATQILNGSMTLGDFVAAVHYLYSIIWPLIAMGLIANTFQKGIASMTRLNEVFASESTVQEKENAAGLKNFSGKITFNDVSFRYGKDLPWILKNVSFELEPGESLAILGKTGAGKSTIIDLILRRYDVTEGEILFDGVDIKDLSFEALYEALSVVPQDGFLFSRSIAENISFSTGDLNMEKIKDAAIFAQVDDDIEDMPEKYETVVGERGVTLSGGQKQRVSIARAYYKDAPVMILDDSLSAVDTETESYILNNLRNHNKGLIMISQRISTVKEADNIIVIEDGKITQMGNHDELIRKDGFYSDLYNRQLLESALSKKKNESNKSSDLKSENIYEVREKTEVKEKFEVKEKTMPAEEEAENE